MPQHRFDEGFMARALKRWAGARRIGGRGTSERHVRADDECDEADRRRGAEKPAGIGRACWMPFGEGSDNKDDAEHTHVRRRFVRARHTCT